MIFRRIYNESFTFQTRVTSNPHYSILAPNGASFERRTLTFNKNKKEKSIISITLALWTCNRYLCVFILQLVPEVYLGNFVIVMRNVAWFPHLSTEHTNNLFLFSNNNFCNVVNPEQCRTSSLARLTCTATSPGLRNRYVDFSPICVRFAYTWKRWRENDINSS